MSRHDDSWKFDPAVDRARARLRVLAIWALLGILGATALYQADSALFRTLIGAVSAITPASR